MFSFNQTKYTCDLNEQQQAFKRNMQEISTGLDVNLVWPIFFINIM